MSRLRRRLPSPGLVLATIALLVALGGTAYAGFSVPKHSVGTRQLKDNAVTTSKIKNGAVATSKIKNGAVTGQKIAKKTITGSNINLSTLGTVPSATHAGSADSATTATSADRAITAANTAGVSGPLAPGQTETGMFGMAGQPAGTTPFVQDDAISFPVPLPAAPAFSSTTNVVAPGGRPTRQCPGSEASPSAAAGQLCLYLAVEDGATGITKSTGPTRFGAVVFPTGTTVDTNYETTGTWAVKAP